MNTLKAKAEEKFMPPTKPVRKKTSKPKTPPAKKKANLVVTAAAAAKLDLVPASSGVNRELTAAEITELKADLSTVWAEHNPYEDTGAGHVNSSITLDDPWEQVDNVIPQQSAKKKRKPITFMITALEVRDIGDWNTQCAHFNMFTPFEIRIKPERHWRSKAQYPQKSMKFEIMHGDWKASDIQQHVRGQLLSSYDKVHSVKGARGSVPTLRAKNFTERLWNCRQTRWLVIMFNSKYKPEK